VHKILLLKTFKKIKYLNGSVHVSKRWQNFHIWVNYPFKYLMFTYRAHVTWLVGSSSETLII